MVLSQKADTEYMKKRGWEITKRAMDAMQKTHRVCGRCGLPCLLLLRCMAALARDRHISIPSQSIFVFFLSSSSINFNGRRTALTG